MLRQKVRDINMAPSLDPSEAKLEARKLSVIPSADDTPAIISCNPISLVEGFQQRTHVATQNASTSPSESCPTMHCCFCPIQLRDSSRFSNTYPARHHDSERHSTNNTVDVDRGCSDCSCSIRTVHARAECGLYDEQCWKCRTWQG